MNTPSQPSKTVLIQLAIDVLKLSFSADEVGNKTLAELDIDSLQIIELEMELEDRFGFHFNTDNISADMTLFAMLDQTVKSTL